MAVTPLPGLVAAVATGGTPVTPVPINPTGGRITNPPNATFPLYVNPIGAAAIVAGGSTFMLLPGDSWEIIPGQSTPTSVNSPDSAHQFSVWYSL